MASSAANIQAVLITLMTHIGPLLTAGRCLRTLFIDGRIKPGSSQRTSYFSCGQILFYWRSLELLGKTLRFVLASHAAFCSWGVFVSPHQFGFQNPHKLCYLMFTWGRPAGQGEGSLAFSNRNLLLFTTYFWDLTCFLVRGRMPDPWILRFLWCLFLSLFWFAVGHTVLPYVRLFLLL